MVSIEGIDPRLLGQRLQAARKARGVTQEEVAKHLGCSRPTLIAMEKGERPPRPEEIVSLAGFYGRSVHELVRSGAPPIADFQPHLRVLADRLKSVDGNLEEAIEKLQRFAEDYRELERIMEAPLRTNYPPEVTLAPKLSPVDLAEDLAVRERDRLGLGDQPIINLREILEWDVGLRILYHPLPSAIEGLFAYAEGLGCLIMVNRKHRPEMRRATIAHEYGHLLIDRYRPGIEVSRRSERKPANERFAEAFAMAFLMPATGVRRHFHEVVRDTGDFQVADLLRLRNFYFVSLQAMTIRLEQLGLLPGDSWEYVKGSQFKIGQIGEALDLSTLPSNQESFPERYVFLAVRAWEQEKISEGQLARYLGCHRVAARDLAERYLTVPALDTESGQHPLKVEFQRSLLNQAS